MPSSRGGAEHTNADGATTFSDAEAPVVRPDADPRTMPSAMHAMFAGDVAIVPLPGGSTFRLPVGRPVFASAGLYPADLSLDCLKEAGISLVEALHAAGPVAAVTSDHARYWSWARVVVRAGVELERFGLGSLLDAAVALGVAAARGEPRDDSLPPSVAGMVAECDASFVLGYAAFPLLEAAVRLACRDFISLSGAVRREFTDRASGRLYRPMGGRGRGRAVCRSLQDALALLADEVASPCLREMLRRWSSAAEPHADGTVVAPFAAIAGWGAEVAHDDVVWRGRAAAALTMALLILLEPVTADRYDAIRARRAAADLPRAAGEGARLTGQLLPTVPVR